MQVEPNVASEIVNILIDSRTDEDAHKNEELAKFLSIDKTNAERQAFKDDVGASPPPTTLPGHSSRQLEGIW